MSSAANGHPRRLIITSGNMEENRQFFSEHPVACPVLVQQELEVSVAYGVKGTPAGYLIDAEGRIASQLALGADMLMALASERSESVVPRNRSDQGPIEAGTVLPNRFSSYSLSRSKLKRDGLKAGTPAPDFQLPRVDGRGELSLSSLRGQRVFLVFSSPHCGPCNELAPTLEKFHRRRPDIEMVMISKGEPDENRAKIKEHELTFAIALQQGWAVSRLYAIFATPAAYLIDQEGVITLDVAVGTEPIRNLLASITRSKEPKN